MEFLPILIFFAIVAASISSSNKKKGKVKEKPTAQRGRPRPQVISRKITLEDLESFGKAERAAMSKPAVTPVPAATAAPAIQEIPAVAPSPLTDSIEEFHAAEPESAGGLNIEGLTEEEKLIVYTEIMQPKYDS